MADNSKVMEDWFHTVPPLCADMAWTMIPCCLSGLRPNPEYSPAPIFPCALRILSRNAHEAWRVPLKQCLNSQRGHDFLTQLGSTLGSTVSVFHIRKTCTEYIAFLPPRAILVTATDSELANFSQPQPQRPMNPMTQWRLES